MIVTTTMLDDGFMVCTEMASGPVSLTAQFPISRTEAEAEAVAKAVTTLSGLTILTASALRSAKGAAISFRDVENEIASRVLVEGMSRTTERTAA